MTNIFVFPGQGSQKVGMGEDLFDQFPELIKQADQLLGYSVKEMCLTDTENKITLTQYTQPLLYIVNALTYLKKIGKTNQKPDYVAGHSLGEYNALFAAETFDFLTGLKLVQKRGEIMGKVSGSGMAAVIGLSKEDIENVMKEHAITGLDVANYNASNQIVLAGSKEDIKSAQPHFKERKARYIVLNVSAAFHSRYMKEAGEEFEAFLKDFSFTPPKIPVISNVTAKPYKEDVLENLAKQITSPVRWYETVEYLLETPEPEFQEMGPGNVLSGLIRRIKRTKAKK